MSHINDSMTLLTDYLIAVQTGWFTYALLHQRQGSRLLWGMSFLATSIAAFLGGTYHGFSHAFSLEVTQGLWRITMYCAGFVSYFSLLGTVSASVSQKWYRMALYLATVKLFVYLIWMTIDIQFLGFIVDYLVANLIILALQLRKSAPSSTWIVWGLFWSFVAAGIQQSKMSLVSSLNHNDLAHLVQLNAFYSFYRGANLLQDKQPFS